MSNIDLSIILKESDKEIKNKILRAIVTDVNKKVKSRLKYIQEKIKDLTFLWLTSTITYQSLVDGDLAGHFGLTKNRHVFLGYLIKIICDNIVIRHKDFVVRNDKIANGLFIYVVIKDFSDILASPYATVITEDGEILEWLKWLLTKGDSIIIREYEIDFEDGAGRSGLAIMIPEIAGVWRVPPEFSGTMRNNWLTRAFTNYVDMYLDHMTKIIEKELQSL